MTVRLHVLHPLLLGLLPGLAGCNDTQSQPGQEPTMTAPDSIIMTSPAFRDGQHYRFTVYALTSATGLPTGADLHRALKAIDSSAVARGRLVGTYAR